MREKNDIIKYNCLPPPRGEPRLELGVHRLWNYVELFWNSLDNAPSSIVFYLEIKVGVEVGVGTRYYVAVHPSASTYI